MSNGTTTWTYTYDANGMRTKRTNGTTTYSYVYNGSQLVQMTVGNDILYFTYDAYGLPMTVTHNGTLYYYVTNIQGDVLAILDSTGVPVAWYTHDAWGNEIPYYYDIPLSTIRQLNPLRYRGYVYDTETDLYYLQSRYYNPEWGRFLNADSYISTGQGFLGNNMFAYCLNNPVNYVDPSGSIPFSDRFFDEAFQNIGEMIGWWLKDTVEEKGDEIIEQTNNTWNEITNSISGFATNIWNRFASIDWGKVIEDTTVSAITGATGGGATGYIAGYWGIPFTEGVSLGVCTIYGVLIGGIGGTIEGFLKSVWDEFTK